MARRGLTQPAGVFSRRDPGSGLAGGREASPTSDTLRRTHMVRPNLGCPMACLPPCASWAASLLEPAYNLTLLPLPLPPPTLPPPPLQTTVPGGRCQCPPPPTPPHPTPPPPPPPPARRATEAHLGDDTYFFEVGPRRDLVAAGEALGDGSQPGDAAPYK
jgi:hypothetical protein